MKLLFEGAEARVYKTKFFGEKAITKQRQAKPYRAKALDQKIIAERTKQECLLLAKAKNAGVRTPCILFADKKNGTIVMEFVVAKKVSSLKAKPFDKAVFLAGTATADMHKAGIVHGDLTTANLCFDGKKVFFLDFGLGFFSEKIEDKAVDVLVMKKTLKATVPKNTKAWEKFLQGYGKKNVQAKQVVERIAEIEKRTRYS